MPEEIEVPTEHLHESLEEAAHGAHGAHGHAAPQGRDWISHVAVTAAVLAVLAAVAALLAGHHANEGVLESIQASDRWSYYQAKGIKSSVLSTKVELLRELEHTPKPADEKQIEAYRDEQKEIEAEAKGLERSSEQHMHVHNIFGRTVTLFQIGIALAAISVLSRRKWVWFGSLALSAVGVASLLQALL